jgi:hypothetical protein
MRMLLKWSVDKRVERGRAPHLMTDALSTSQAAIYLGVSVDSLKRAVRKGKISPASREGKLGVWKFDMETLERTRSNAIFGKVPRPKGVGSPTVLRAIQDPQDLPAVAQRVVSKLLAIVEGSKNNRDVIGAAKALYDYLTAPVAPAPPASAPAKPLPWGASN